ncbi:hypothetical protein ACSMXM_05490 [Pacificimonas sp. ICDLI1SI03]
MPMVANSVLDAALDKIATATAVHLLVAEPADRAAAIANSLASYAPTFSAPSDAAGGGRQITKQSGSDTTAEMTGDPTVRAYINADELLYVEPEGGAVTIGAGGAVNDGASTITFRDPTFS